MDHKWAVILSFLFNQGLTSEDCSKVLDCMFVVDGSGSIGTKTFNLVRSWLINQTLEIYDTFGSCAQVQVLQYSNKDPVRFRVRIEDSKQFVIPFVLGECVEDETCVRERINGMKYLSSRTYTYYALRRAMEVEFPKSNVYEESVKIVIVITDGEANDATFLKNWYLKYKDIVTSFAVGIGNHQKFRDQLRAIANGNTGDERVFSVDQIGSLQHIQLKEVIENVVTNSSTVEREV